MKTLESIFMFLAWVAGFILGAWFVYLLLPHILVITANILWGVK